MDEIYTTPKPKADKNLKFLFDMVEPVVFALIAVVLISLFLGRLTTVDGESMEDTLHHGEYLIVADPFLSYEPKQGDIVVVRGDFEGTYYDKPIVKRVIATGGDKVEIDFSLPYAPKVRVNGKTYETEYETYKFDTIYSTGNGVKITCFEDYELYYLGYDYIGTPLENCNKNYNYSTKKLTVEVPAGQVFLMGDNRYHSADSRITDIGCVPEKYIQGKAIFRLLPFNKIGGLYKD
ncbi:MAG: signal peptidase I [Ruminococcaceae bacterium]|nr:signal peptidase I [Oscillospiraceae bacterium]